MYPIFESKWFITISKLRHGFYTVVKKMKFSTGLHKLHILNANNFDAVRSSKRPAKKSLNIAISFRVRRSEGVRAYNIFEPK